PRVRRRPAGRPARAPKARRGSIGRIRTSASYLDNPDRAFLEVGLERYRVGCIQRDLVDQLARVEPRNEYQSARRLVAAASFYSRSHAAATRRDLHLHTTPHAER